MTIRRNWVTNSPVAAAALKAADKAYDKAIDAARGMRLADMVVAHREAKQVRDAAYETVWQESLANGATIIGGTNQ